MPTHHVTVGCWRTPPPVQESIVSDIQTEPAIQETHTGEKQVLSQQLPSPRPSREVDSQLCRKFRGTLCTVIKVEVLGLWDVTCELSVQRLYGWGWTDGVVFQA